MKITTYVISYNRPSYLRQCVEALQHDQRLDIIIVDNNSDNVNLNEYVNWNKMGENYGHRVCWSQGLVPSDRPYIVTDCDIIVPYKLPWLDLLLSGLDTMPQYNKFGLGLNVRHIPDSNPYKSDIIKHETKTLYRRELPDGRFVEMPVDTTLALYRTGYTNYSIWGTDSNHYTGICKSVRTVAPFEAKHLTWHMTESERQGEENRRYLKSLKPKSTHWSEKR